jgi:hypothetical protein
MDAVLQRTVKEELGKVWATADKKKVNELYRIKAERATKKHKSIENYAPI